MSINTPEWVQHAVFYQIYPDRYARSPRIRHPKSLKFEAWGAPPENQGFQGGDLHGIVDKFDYIEALGVNAIYLNPIFASAANHRYHTYDYFNVDPLLGGNNAFRELLKEAHNRNIRIILDGVFNHVGRGFWPFHHVLENKEKSPYIDWFFIEGWPLRPYSRDENNPANYKSWRGIPALPLLNTHNPDVRKYIFDIARHWIDFGIDGWRLDVPYEIDDDGFWQEFRTIVKKLNPDAYICGEIWGDARRWLKGDQFDAVMNYFFMTLALGYFGSQTLRTDYEHIHLSFRSLNTEQFAQQITDMYGLYAEPINRVQLNLIDSHDTARTLWLVNDDKSALMLIVLFQMTALGTPCIYYGDEIGLSSSGDPFCREAFPWNRDDKWDKDLLEFYRSVIQMRKGHEVFRTGSFNILHAKDGLLVFSRISAQQTALVFMNTTPKRIANIQIPTIGKGCLIQVFPEVDQSGAVQRFCGNRLSVPARDAVVLLGE